MFIKPTGALRDWLLTRAMPEADEGLVLSEDQQAMLPNLRAQSAGFKHYDADEQEAWAIWTAYTHFGNTLPPMGTPVVFGGAGTDDLGPTLAIARSSVSAIAKTAHAVDSAIRQLPETLAHVHVAAEQIADHHKHLASHTDKLQACGRELALSLSELERVSRSCAGAATSTAQALDTTNTAVNRVRELVRTMEAFTLHWPEGPVTVMPTLPPAPPVPWYVGHIGEWLRWGALVAFFAADVYLQATHGR